MSALLLAGIIFFLETYMMFCFGLLMKTKLVTQLCFSSCRTVLIQSQELFSFSHCSTSEEALGVQGAMKKTEEGQLTQLAKGMSHTMWHQTKQ